jgi:hypothetical protein
MCGWELLALLVAGAAVWILGNLLRNSTEAERQAAADAAARGRRPPQVTSGELDQFLREVQRRKQQAEQKAAPAQEPARKAPVPPPQAQARQPERRPTQPAPSRAPRRAPGQQLPPSRPRAARPAVERAEPVVLEVVPVVEVVEPAVPTSMVWEDTPATTGVAEKTSPALALRPTDKRAVPPALAQLATMLRSPQNLQMSIVLREILDPPLCRRR